MIVDTSAILAILFDEDDADLYARSLAQAGACRMSAATYVEAAVVVDSQSPAPGFLWTLDSEDRMILAGRHIQDECAYLASRAGTVSREEFLADEDLKRAFVRSLEIIGEATKQISAEFRAQHPELPWRVMARMRDRLIHDYGGVDYGLVWQTSTEDVPPLLRQVGQILEAAS